MFMKRYLYKKKRYITVSGIRTRTSLHYYCKIVVRYCKTFVQNSFNMNTAVAQKSSCIFCNIVNKIENTELLYEDEDVCVFRDIKPASRFHVLTIPKRHIEDVKSLMTPADKELVTKMLAISKTVLLNNNLPVSDARFGYHWPPFRSIKHLHLHTIAPESEMGIISKMIFMKDSYWFVSPEYVESRL